MLKADVKVIKHVLKRQTKVILPFDITSQKSGIDFVLNNLRNISAPY